MSPLSIVAQLELSGLYPWSRLLPPQPRAVEKPVFLELESKLVTATLSSPHVTIMQQSILYKLPPELRAQIFKKVLCDWNGKTPHLLKALRPDAHLYNEALELFYRLNVMSVHLRSWNGWSFKLMSGTAARAIRQLHIEFGISIIKQDFTMRQWNPMSKITMGPNLRSHSISKAANVTTIRIDSNSLSTCGALIRRMIRLPHGTENYISMWRKGLVQVTQDCVETFPRLLSVVILMVLGSTNNPSTIYVAIDREPLITEINMALGLTGRLESVTSHSGTVWFWQVEAGDKLRWKTSKGISA